MKDRSSRRSFGCPAAAIAAALLLVAHAAAAQTSSDPAVRTRPETATATGDTGLWSVPTGEVLPAGTWSVSFSRSETDSGQGFLNTSMFPLSFAVGVGGRTEIFGSWQTITRLDRDTIPLFFDISASRGTGGGIDLQSPFDNAPWIGSRRGDLWLGGKVDLLPADRAVAFAIRPMIKIPASDTSNGGAGTGKVDFSGDAAVSGEVARAVELSGYGGVMIRGNPAGYTLTNGIRWGIGAGFPSRTMVQMTAELFGERYLDHVIIAPPGLRGVDGSPTPPSTTIESPVYLNLGVTIRWHNGFFLGIGGNLNITMPSRDEAGPAFTGNFFDAADYQVRLGFHPGAKARTPASVPAPFVPPPAPVAPVPTAVPATAPPVAALLETPPSINHPPTVKARCNPCSVEVGHASIVTADAQDMDHNALTYAWRAASGTLATPSAQQSVWAAPMATGPVPVTVTVSDGHGGTASDTVNIDVTRPALENYEFSDIYFDYDRYTLLPAAMKALDDVVTTLAADPAINLTIEGYTCDIGTEEDNLALGERRARAVRDYLVARGIVATRLSVVGYGEERPKYDNSREETRMLNRRAVLTITMNR